VRDDPRVTDVRVIAFRGDEREERDDVLATEEPLEIRVELPDGSEHAVAVTMRTPGSDLELAVGFLATEGVIDASDLADPPSKPQGGPGATLVVRLRRSIDLEQVKRSFYATSSCGICGKASIERVELAAPDLAPGPVVTRARIASLPAKLRAAQAVFERTGGLHATGLFDAEGSLLALREDVGRHNAMDKVIGRMLLDDRLPLEGTIALVSGRASFELVQKAAMGGIALLCSVSAPSSLAVQAAERLGATLVGFVRDQSLNVYTHPERVKD